MTLSSHLQTTRRIKSHTAERAFSSGRTFTRQVFPAVEPDKCSKFTRQAFPPVASPPGNRIDGPAIPPPTYTVVPRLPAGSSESLEYLDEHGYVVIASVLTEAEVAEAVHLSWDFVEQCQPDSTIRRTDPTTWCATNWPSDWAARGSNHSAAMWYIRAAPGVTSAWAALLGRSDPDDLIVSFDQLNMSPLPETPADERVAGAWYHTDQSPGFREGPGQATQGSYGLHRDYAQGFIALQRTAEDLDNNVVIPGSHKLFEKWSLDYFDPSPSGGKRGIRYDLLTPEALPSACHGITTHLEPGDAFVWDSRTLHGACTGSHNATAGNGTLLARFAAYVCYSPRSSASAEVIRQRREALASGTGFGHQAHHLHDQTMMRQAKSNTATGPQLRWDDLTGIQRRLVG